MNDTEYQKRTEKRIDSLLEVIEELRQENARLKAQPAPSPAKDEFIRLMGPHMAPIEAKFNETNTTLSEAMCELVRVYHRAKT